MNDSLHVWITGASRGIGAAIAQVLGEHHRCTLSGRNAESIDQVGMLLPGDHAAAVVCDVADMASVRTAHTAAVERFGPVDVLVNNAGIGIFKPLLDLTDQEFEDTIDINLKGIFNCLRVVLPSMKQRRQGMIITMNSIAAVTSYAGCTAYGASKAGALALTRSLRTEVRDHDIKVVDLIVGATSTDIWDAKARDEFADRMMSALDVAYQVDDIVRGFSNPRTHIEELVLRPQHGDL